MQQRFLRPLSFFGGFAQATNKGVSCTALGSRGTRALSGLVINGATALLHPCFLEGPKARVAAMLQKNTARLSDLQIKYWLIGRRQSNCLRLEVHTQQIPVRHAQWALGQQPAAHGRSAQHC